jgi:hypothetical protein
MEELDWRIIFKWTLNRYAVMIIGASRFLGGGPIIYLSNVSSSGVGVPWIATTWQETEL